MLVLPQTRIDSTWGMKHQVATVTATLGCGEVRRPWRGNRYTIELTGEERQRLNRLIRSGTSSARIVARARILLKIDEGWNAPRVAVALDVSGGAVRRIKRRYADEGLDGVLLDRVQANRFRKLDDVGALRRSPPDCFGVQSIARGP